VFESPPLCSNRRRWVLACPPARLAPSPCHLARPSHVVSPVLVIVSIVVVVVSIVVVVVCLARPRFVRPSSLSSHPSPCQLACPPRSSLRSSLSPCPSASLWRCLASSRSSFPSSLLPQPSQPSSVSLLSLSCVLSPLRCVLSHFLVVVSSHIRPHVIPHPSRPSSLLLLGFVSFWWQGKMYQ
jgi:hypothetical protein